MGFWKALKWLVAAMAAIFMVLATLIWRELPDTAPRHPDHIYCDMAIAIIAKEGIGGPEGFKHIGPCNAEAIAENVRRVSGLYVTPITQHNDTPALTYRAIVARDDKRDRYALCRFGLAGERATVRSRDRICEGHR